MIFEAIKAKRAEAQEQLLLSLEYIPWRIAIASM
jgi:hypothetical protein